MQIIDIVYCKSLDPEHSTALSTLINAYIADEMGGGNPLSKEQQRRLTEGLRSHPKSIILLARIDSTYVGMLTAFENFSTFAAQPAINIHDLFVQKAYRGKGVGRKLMNAIIEEARQRKCSRLTLEVRKDNCRAQQLYQSLGFDEAPNQMLFWQKPLNNTAQES
jgi:ribosomal protein S18 acetylase RimI-like enzyme